MRAGGTTGLACALALCAALTGRVCAQPMELKKVGISVESVQWGFGRGEVSAECWTPVRVLMQGGDKAFTGVLTLTYAQDASQRAAVSTFFSTTPGRIIPVETMVCVPYSCDAITMTITDAQSGKSQNVEFVNAPTVRELPLPGIDTTPLRVLRVGDAAPQQAFHHGDDFSQSPQAAQGVTPGGKPNGGADDGTEVGIGAQPPGETDATLVDEDGNVINPTPPTAPPASLAPPTPSPMPGVLGPGKGSSDQRDLWWKQCAAGVATPLDLPTSWMAYDGVTLVVAREDDLWKADVRALDALRTWVRSGGRLALIVSQAGSRLGELLPEVGKAVAVENATSVSIGPTFAPVLHGAAPAKSAIARRCTITPEGKRSGWETGWKVESGGLIAVGPARLGRVVLLGVDPASLSDIRSNESTSWAWRDAATKVLPWYAFFPEGSMRGYYGQISRDEVAGTALRMLLDQISTTPPVGSGLFVSILLATGALAIAVGPLGRIFLKRRKWLSRSWVAALACIAITSIGALLLPKMLRSGQTAANRASFVDCVLDASGNCEGGASSGMVCVFAGRPGTMPLPSAGERAWWRGFSTRFSYNNTASRADPVDLTLPAAGAGQRENLLPEPCAFGQWTFRAFLDQSPDVPDFASSAHVALRRDGGEVLVRITGLPEGARLTEARLLTTKGQLPLTVVPRAGEAAEEGVLKAWNSITMFDRTEKSIDGKVEVKDVAPYGYLDQTLLLRSAGERECIPGPRERSGALQERIDAGWGVLYVRVEGLDLAWDNANWLPASTSHVAFVRFAVPPEVIGQSLDGVPPLAPQPPPSTSPPPPQAPIHGGITR